MIEHKHGEPLISIVMPYKNSATTLIECIKSIVAQKMSQFELIAVNDGSTDNSLAILSTLNDDRIQLVENPGSGIVDALNFGISIAKTRWIARMDADDIMSPDRLQKQWQYLQHNRDVKCIGSRVQLFPEENIANGMRNYIKWQNNQLTHHQIITGLLQESTLTHPSVLVEKKSLLSVHGYRQGDFPEDYDLWLRLADSNIKFGKVDASLLLWREHNEKLTRTDRRYSLDAFNSLRVEYLLSRKDILQARRVVIWGAGRKTRKRVDVAVSRGLVIDAWVDIDPKKIAQRIDGLPVLNPSMLTPKTGTVILVYVNSHGAKPKIDKFLINKGFEYGQDYFHVG